MKSYRVGNKDLERGVCQQALLRKYSKPFWSYEQIEIYLSFLETLEYILSRKGFLSILKA